MDRYTIKWQGSYGVETDGMSNLDDALAEFLSLHSEGVKVQLTAEVPKEEKEKDEWDF